MRARKPPRVLDACEEAGLLIWNDFALQWAYDDTDDFKANAAEQIRDFVRLLYNHPSIIVWACQNEPVWNTLTLTPILAAAVAEEDSTRVVVPAAGFDQHTYNGWYGGTMDEYVMVPAAPFNTEFGAQALPDLETMRAMFGPEELWPTRREHWENGPSTTSSTTRPSTSRGSIGARASRSLSPTPSATSTTCSSSPSRATGRTSTPR